jgi:hypothetical protein
MLGFISQSSKSISLLTKSACSLQVVVADERCGLSSWLDPWGLVKGAVSEGAFSGPVTGCLTVVAHTIWQACVKTKQIKNGRKMEMKGQ